MVYVNRRLGLFPIAALVPMVALVLALAPSAPSAVLPAVTVPANTAIHVRLQETLSSKQSRPGQEFTTVLDQPLVVNGKTVAPKGATVHGMVASARRSGRLKTPAALYLRLTAIEVNGKRHPIVTRLVGRTAHSHKKRNLMMIGGGTGLGAAIGAIATGGVGAAIGAAAGAGAGTTAAALTGKKDIQYPVETLLTFRLASPATLQ